MCDDYISIVLINTGFNLNFLAAIKNFNFSPKLFKFLKLVWSVF